jgi:hypothetical protein
VETFRTEGYGGCRIFCLARACVSSSARAMTRVDRIPAARALAAATLGDRQGRGHRCRRCLLGQCRRQCPGRHSTPRHVTLLCSMFRVDKIHLSTWVSFPSCTIGRPTKADLWPAAVGAALGIVPLAAWFANREATRCGARDTGKSRHAHGKFSIFPVRSEAEIRIYPLILVRPRSACAAGIPSRRHGRFPILL